MHPRLKRPTTLQELSKQYGEAPAGSELRERIEADMKHFESLDKKHAESLRASRRRDLFDAEALRDSIQDGEPRERLDILEAQERQLEVSACTPLHPAIKTDESRIQDILCKESAAAAARGIQNLTKLGIPAERMKQLSKIPVLLAAAANGKDAKDVAAMTDEELCDWQDDCGTEHADYYALETEPVSGSSSSEEDQEEDEAYKEEDVGSTGDEGSDFEDTTDPSIHEAALDWSIAALQKTAAGTAAQHHISIKWSEEEEAIVVQTLQTALGEEWWTANTLRGSNVYNTALKALHAQGFAARTYTHVTNKVKNLFAKMRAKTV